MGASWPQLNTVNSWSVIFMMLPLKYRCLMLISNSATVSQSLSQDLELNLILLYWTFVRMFVPLGWILQNIDKGPHWNQCEIQWAMMEMWVEWVDITSFLTNPKIYVWNKQDRWSLISILSKLKLCYFFICWKRIFIYWDTKYRLIIFLLTPFNFLKPALKQHIYDVIVPCWSSTISNVHRYLHIFIRYTFIIIPI